MYTQHKEEATSMSSALLWIAALQLLVLVISSANASQSCGSLSEAELIKRKIESVKLNLYAQLGMTEEEQLSIPENATVTPPSNETLEEFRALVNASITIEENREKKCLSEDFYAKPVSFFAGSMHLDGEPCMHATAVEIVCINIFTSAFSGAYGLVPKKLPQSRVHTRQLAPFRIIAVNLAIMQSLTSILCIGNKGRDLMYNG